MAYTPISHGEADIASEKMATVDKEVIVTFRNRFGREVDVPRYNAKKMVRRFEGEIISDPSPAYAELLKVRVQYENKFGRPANTKWTVEKINSQLNSAPNASEKSDLVSKYVEKFGKKPFAGWTVDELKNKLSNS